MLLQHFLPYSLSSSSSAGKQALGSFSKPIWFVTCLITEAKEMSTGLLILYLGRWPLPLGGRSLSGRVQFSKKNFGVWRQDGPKPSQCIAQSKHSQHLLFTYLSLQEDCNSLKVDQVSNLHIHPWHLICHTLFGTNNKWGHKMFKARL